MKRVLFFVTALLSVQSFAQCDGRYETEIFSSVSVTEVEYTDVYDWGVTDSGLDMDVYTPDGDTLSERPLIVFIHGGSFYLGNKDNLAMVDLCESFAKRGYVTASIQYRLTTVWNLTDSMHMLQTVMNGISDAKAAIRYFRKDAATNGNAFGVDVNQVYVGGYSAGAIIATNLAYINDTTSLPSYLLPIVNSIGGLEGNSGNSGYSSEVEAVVNIAGAVYKTSYIDADDVPIVSVHAADDTTVPYYCDNAMSNPLILEVCGSGTIHDVVAPLGIYNELHTFSTGGHAAPVTQLASVSVPFISDFLYTTLDCYEAVSVNEEEQFFEVYPNPVRESFVVREQSLLLEISLFDMMGRKVLSASADGFEKQISVEGFDSGIYLLSIETEEGVEFQKIFIE